MSAAFKEEPEAPPPHSVQFEQAVLGSVLLGAKPPALATDDFHRRDHQLIWTALDALRRAGNSPDVLLVFRELERTQNIDAAGGLGYLKTLTDNTPDSANVEKYAKEVRELARQRRLFFLGFEIQRELSSGATSSQIALGLQPLLEAFAQPDGSKTKLQTLDFGQMRPHVKDGYLVKGLFHRGTLVAINGVSGSGKTFFATDIAMHLAANRAWRGMRVQGGTVVYGALEGPASAENRFVAGRLSGGLPETLPLRLTPGPINLRDTADVLDLITVATEAASDFGQPCVAVFVDTLSRAMSGGDENGPEDMGALIRGADAVRLATGAAVFLVHHLGKDESRGGRGHSSLKGALDTEIEVSARDGLHIAAVTKQRDLASGAHYAYRLKVVELGRDEDGDPVTTCVVDPVDQEPAAPKRKEPVGDNQRKLLAALQERHRQNPAADLISTADLQAIAEAQGIDRKRRQEVVEKLLEYSWLQRCAGGYRYLPEEPAP